MNNYEYIDRIIIAVENKIKNNTEIDIETIKVLLSLIRDLSNKKVIEQIEHHHEEQKLLNYD
jgi:hypothetical protein